MKLPDPVIAFKGASGVLTAKSISDHRWYKVQGITKILDSIMCCRSRSRSHNMIIMDLFTRVVSDLNANPFSSLEWVLEYANHINAPNRKGLELHAGLLQIFKYNKAPSLTTCRRLWDRLRLSSSIGVKIDAKCKDVFNGKKSKGEVGPVS